jgi:hypothetical protein
MKMSGLIAAALRMKFFSSPLLGDLGGDFEAADIGRAHQKLGAEIAADKITAAMDEFIIWAVEAAPDLVAPPRERHCPIPTSLMRRGAPDRAPSGPT